MKRNRTEHLTAILDACSKGEGLKLSHVGYATNLTCGLLHPYLTFLLGRKLAEEFYPTRRMNRKKGKFPCYRATEEGKRVVRLYREVEKALEMKT